MDPSRITAIILAGGAGTRLRAALPDGMPKVLAPVAGHPFLALVLERLAETGIRRAVLCTGFGADAVEKSLGSKFGPMSLAYSRESSPLGTAGALRSALEIVGGDTLLALNGDTLVEADLGAFNRWFEGLGASAGLLLVPASGSDSCGMVETDVQGRVTAFNEKPGTGQGADSWASAGVYVFSRKFLLVIPCGRPVSLEYEILPQAVGRGLFGYRTEGRFWDIGTPETYSLVKERFS